MNRINTILRMAAVLLLTVCLLSGCSMSSIGQPGVFSNQDLDNPKQAVLDFVDAMKAEKFDTAAADNAMSYVGNYSTMGFEKFTLVDDSVETLLFDALRESYAVTFADSDLSPVRIPCRTEDMSVAGKQAFVTFDFTSLDFSLMSEALTVAVAEVGAERMYDGAVYDTQETAMALVEEVYSTTFLEENKVSDFYVTRPVTLELQFTDDGWKIVVSEEFYDALLGR